MLKRNDTMVLTAKHNTWLKRTPEEVKALRDRDIADGRFHDDGGEPILYGNYSAVPFEAMPITVTVTSLRPKWVGYNRRPKHLIAGWCDALKREVLFQETPHR